MTVSWSAAGDNHTAEVNSKVHLQGGLLDWFWYLSFNSNSAVRTMSGLHGRVWNSCVDTRDGDEGTVADDRQTRRKSLLSFQQQQRDSFQSFLPESSPSSSSSSPNVCSSMPMSECERAAT